MPIKLEQKQDNDQLPTDGCRLVDRRQQTGRQRSELGCLKCSNFPSDFLRRVSRSSHGP